MSRLVRELVLDAPAAEVGLAHDVELLQELKGAVDGGDVDERVLLGDAFVDLFGGDVPLGVVDDGDDEHALRGEAIAHLAQGLHDRAVPAHNRNS